MERQSPPQEEPEYLNEYVFHGDKLYSVPESEMSNQLHKHIVAITFINIKHPNQLKKGSGFLVSSNLVLTAAQNFYDAKEKVFSEQVKIYPGQCGPLKKYYEVQDFFFPGKYNYSPDLANNFVLLKLSQKLEESNFIQMSGNIKKLNKESKLAIFGYSDKSYMKDSQVFQRGIIQAGRIIEKRKNQNELIHQISTEPGHHGAPVILIKNDGNLNIIGMHINAIETEVGGSEDIFNGAILFTSELIDCFKNEALRMGAQFPEYQKQETQNKPKKAKEEKNVEKTSNTSKISSEKSKQIELFLKQGSLSLSKRQFQAAITSFNLIIQIDSQNEEAYYNKGFALMQIGQPKQAVNNFRKAIKINQKYKEAHYQLGNGLKQIKELKQAILCYRKAVEIDPQYKDAYQKLTIALLQVGQEIEPLELSLKGKISSTFLKEHKSDKYWHPNDMIGFYFNLMNTLNHGDKVKSHIAKAYIISLLKNTSDNSFMQPKKNSYSFAKRLEEYNFLEQAIQSYQIALELDPNFIEASYYQGLLLLKTGRSKEAINNFRRIVARNPTAEAIFYLGSALDDDGNIQEALKYYQKSIEKNYKNYEAHFKMGLVYRRKEQFQQALECFQKTVKFNPHHQQAHSNIGSLMIQLERYPQAIGHLNTSVKLDKHDKNSFNSLGIAQCKMGDIKGSMLSLFAAIEIDPDFEIAYETLTQTLQEIGSQKDILQALNFVKQKAKLYPKKTMIADYELMLKSLIKQ